MATIIKQPDSLSFSKNWRKFEIAASSEVTFKLSQGGSLIIAESYTPNASGRVIVDIADVVSNFLSFNIPTTDIFEQISIAKEFTVEIDSLAAVNFTIIRGGVENLADTATNFLLANWLTWQPQSKMVGYSQPEWLTYYAPVAAVVKIKYYLTDETSSVITLHTPAAGTCYTYNMQFAHIMSLYAGDKLGYYDVWVESATGTRLTYIQRYVYKEPEDLDEYFIFQNSLGGIDTAVMAGESNFNPDLEHTEGSYDDVSVQIDNYYKRIYEKSTGWLSKTYADWLFDFFNSCFRYKLVSGVLRGITLQDSSISDSSQEDLKSFSFSYKFAEDKGLLNLPRTMEPLPDNLEISTPEGLFFLAPRLVDFPSAELDDTFLFPVQSPFTTFWQKLSWGAIWNFLYDKIVVSAIGVMAHMHDNFSVLSKFSESEGNLYYNEAPVGGGSGSDAGLQLGTTSKTAHRGDQGKAAYDHSILTKIHFADAPIDGQSYARNSEEWVTIPSAGGAAVRLSTNNQVFEYDEAGNIVDTSAFAWIYTTLFNISGDTIYYEFQQNGVTLQNTTSSVLPYSPPQSFTSPDVIEVYVRIGSPSSSTVAFDSLSMYGIKPGGDGKDAFTVVLSNPAHSFPANSDGTVTDYSGSGTDIRVWKGITPLPFGTGSLTFGVSATGYSLTPGSAATSSIYIRRYYNASNMVASIGRIEFSISARDENSNQYDFVQTQSFTTSKQGLPGSDGTPGAVGPSLVFRGEYNSAATYIGNSKRIDMVEYNGNNYSALPTAGSFSGKAPIDALYWQIADGQFDFVATNLLFAKSTYVRNLIAEQLKTAESGKRVEINAGDKQQIAIYDSLEKLKVLVKPEPISTLSVIQAGASTAYHSATADVTIKNSSWATPNFGSLSYQQVSTSFVVTLDGTLEIEIGGISLTVGKQDGTYAAVMASVIVVLEKYTNYSWSHVATIGSCTEADSSKYVSNTIKGLSAGTYRLVANHYHNSWTDWIEGMPVIQDSCSAYTSWGYASGSVFSITVRRVIAQTEIGTDGIASIWATNKYLHFSQNGLFIKMGTKTFEVTDHAVKINGTTYN